MTQPSYEVTMAGTLNPERIQWMDDRTFDPHFFQATLQQFTIFHVIVPTFATDEGPFKKTDRHTIFFILRGTVTITPSSVFGAQAAITLLPGQTFVHRASGTSRAQAFDGLEVIMLNIPGNLLTNRGLKDQDTLLAPGPTVDLLRDMLIQFVRIGIPANAPAELAFARALEEAVFAVLVTQEDMVPALDQVDRGQFDRALRCIRSRCADRQLTPQQVAAHLEIPLRSLQRLFSRAGTTVTAQIQLARVRAAEAILISDENRTLRMADIASRSGFSSEARLRSAMTAVNGVSPRGFRATRQP